MRGFERQRPSPSKTCVYGALSKNLWVVSIDVFWISDSDAVLYMTKEAFYISTVALVNVQQFLSVTFTLP